MGANCFTHTPPTLRKVSSVAWVVPALGACTITTCVVDDGRVCSLPASVAGGAGLGVAVGRGFDGEGLGRGVTLAVGDFEGTGGAEELAPADTVGPKTGGATGAVLAGD